MRAADPLDMPPPEALRLCVIGQRYQLAREYVSIYEALARRFELTTVMVDDGWPTTVGDVPEHDRYDAILWFVRFRELIERPAFHWNQFRGLRLMYDQDAYQNFNQMAGTTRFLGRWPEVFRRHEFDVLLCTGRNTRDNLASAGVKAMWWPKAVDTRRFFSKGQPRGGVCYFGERYAARTMMLDHVSKASIAVDEFRCSYFELNARLNRFAACLICNMEADVGSVFARFARYFTNSPPPKLGPAPETMLKNFEVAATGCAPICDFIPEMTELGFRDGETAVTYSTFEELVHKLRRFAKEPEELLAIGSRAAELARTRHSWDERAAELASYIEGYESDER